MSRLTIEISEQQHQALKAMAALEGKTIKEYTVERLFPNMADDEQAMAELRKLLSARVSEASRGEVSAKSISEIAADTTQASAIR